MSLQGLDVKIIVLGSGCFLLLKKVLTRTQNGYTTDVEPGKATRKANRRPALSSPKSTVKKFFVDNEDTRHLPSALEATFRSCRVSPQRFSVPFRHSLMPMTSGICTAWHRVAGLVF